MVEFEIFVSYCIFEGIIFWVEVGGILYMGKRLVFVLVVKLVEVGVDVDSLFYMCWCGSDFVVMKWFKIGVLVEKYRKD